ncbi:hypothetical protein ACL90Y_09465 [Micrococcus luteus]
MRDRPTDARRPARRRSRWQQAHVLWGLTVALLAVAVAGFVTDANTVPQEGVPGSNGTSALWLGILGAAGAVLCGGLATVLSLLSAPLRRSGLLGLGAFAVLGLTRFEGIPWPSDLQAVVTLLAPVLLLAAGVLAFTARVPAAGSVSARPRPRRR